MTQEPQTAAHPPHRQLRIGLAVVAATVVATLLLLEIAARIWVGVKWESSDIERATELPVARGGYLQDPLLGYRLQPGYTNRDGTERDFSYNALGMRGSPLPAEGDSVLRIVVMGASTVFGMFASDDQTSSALLQKILSDRYPGRRIQVFNAGVPGYTSRETRFLVPHVLENVKPHIVFVVDGRNEVFPELYNGYTPDYTHFRDTSWALTKANKGWRTFFRLSHAAMILIPNGRGVLGYSLRKESPAYGNIRFGNQPTMRQIRQNIARPDLLAGWTANVTTTLGMIAAQGATPVVVEMPFLASQYGSATLPRSVASPDEDGELMALLDDLVNRNNDAARQIAEAHRYPFLRTGSVVAERFLVDDCHFNAEGERAFAELMAGVVEDVLRQESR